MNRLKDYTSRHRRALLVIAGVFCLYTLLGFLFVPWLAERKLVTTLQQRLGATASVEAIHFNPFTFTASIDVLDLQTADGEPLLGLQRLYLNADPLRLFLLKLRIAEITIDTLELHYNRYSESDDTIARLAQRWNDTAEPVEEESAAGADAAKTEEDLARLEIGRVQYINGSIHYRDAVPATDFTTTLGPLNIDIADVSTLPDDEKTGTKDLVLQIEQDATLTWNSSFEITPLQFSGRLALDNFSLTTPYRYFQDSLPFVLRDGRVAAQFDYVFSLDETTGPRLELSNLGVQVSALDAVENGSDTAFLHSGTVVLENGSFLYPDMQAKAGALRVDGLNIALLQNAAGELNLQRMLNQLATGEEDTVDDSATPLQLTVDEFALANTAVSFNGSATQTPATLNLNARATLQGFTLAPGTALPFDLGLTLDTGGTLDAKGTVQLFPALSLDATLELAGLSLLPIQPYIDEYAQLTLESGNLGFSAHLLSNETETLAWQGDLTLDNLKLVDRQRNETLFSMTALRAGNIDFSLSGKRLDTSELILDAAYGRVFIDESGFSNIRAALELPAPGEETPATTEDQAELPAAQPTQPFAISLGRVQINDASSDFTDRSLPIVFDTQMHSLQGEISDFSSASSQAMTVGLEGQVDEFGLVEISGALDPLNATQQTEITLAFTNLDLSSMTPYVIKFAGREIAEGRADVVLTYAIAEDALQANNSIVLRDLRLGERVEYPGAMDLPLDLAVALLKNRDGVIDLDIPVSGDVDDPQFDMGPAIRQAIFNVLVGIVTSPFRLLSGLIGGGEDEINDIRFRPGRSDLAPPELETLQKLTSALTQRPQLVLTIPAPMETAADTQALQTSILDARVEEQLALDESDEQLPDRRRAVLETLYETAMLTPALEELRLQFTSTPARAEGERDEPEPVFDALAYSSDLRERLIDAEPVTETMLQDLARARQAAIAAQLTMSGEITLDRLQNQDVSAGDIEDGWIHGAFDVDVMQ